MLKFWLCNVVVYDGCDSFVVKQIVQAENGIITKDSKDRLIMLYKGNADVLKFDLLYPLSLENVIAMKNDEQYKNVYIDFEALYFTL